jgi:hypothetical protein
MLREVLSISLPDDAARRPQAQRGCGAVLVLGFERALGGLANGAIWLLAPRAGRSGSFCRWCCPRPDWCAGWFRPSASSVCSAPGCGSCRLWASLRVRLWWHGWWRRQEAGNRPVGSPRFAVPSGCDWRGNFSTVRQSVHVFADSKDFWSSAMLSAKFLNGLKHKLILPRLFEIPCLKSLLVNLYLESPCHEVQSSPDHAEWCRRHGGHCQPRITG